MLIDCKIQWRRHDRIAQRPQCCFVDWVSVAFVCVHAAIPPWHMFKHVVPSFLNQFLLRYNAWLLPLSKSGWALSMHIQFIRFAIYLESNSHWHSRHAGELSRAMLLLSHCPQVCFQYILLWTSTINSELLFFLGCLEFIVRGLLASTSS